MALAIAGGIGNTLTIPVCREMGAPLQYCWVPHYRNSRPFNYTQFWKTNGHTIVAQLDAPVQPVTYNAIVHLRCGDVLVRRHPVYTIADTPCFERALAWLDRFDTVTFMSGGHVDKSIREQAEKQCDELIAKFLVVLRRSFDVRVLRIRESWDDWWLLHRAQRVLAIVPSSFVFSAKAHALTEVRMLSPIYRDRPVWKHCNTTSNQTYRQQQDTASS